MTPKDSLHHLRAEHEGALLVADALLNATAQTAPCLVEAFLEFFDDFSWEHLVSEEARQIRLEEAQDIFNNYYDKYLILIENCKS